MFEVYDLFWHSFTFSHWKELMNKTGQKFDINPETFTLANVFSMELHRFQETIGEIVTMASKEMGIEKVSYFGVLSFIFIFKKELSFKYKNLKFYKSIKLYFQTGSERN